LSEEPVLNLAEIQNDFYITILENVGHVGHQNATTKKLTRALLMLLHLLHALKEGAKAVLVRIVDSDVDVIFCSPHRVKKLADISEHCQVFISFRTGNNNGLIDIERITIVLRPLRSHALPLWYTLTGSDSTSSMKGRSKRIAFNA
jgi:hypothetical protein